MSTAVTAEIAIEAPLDAVWEVVMDPKRLEDWVTIHRGLGELPDSELGPGSSFVQELELAGTPFRVSWEVTRIERPNAADWAGDGPAGATARVEYRLASAGEGTRLRYLNEFSFPGGALGALAGRIALRSRAQREADRSLERLKALVERSREAR